MDPSKTRIWRGGLNELVGSGDPPDAAHGGEGIRSGAARGSEPPPRSIPTRIEAPRFNQPKPNVLQPSRSEPSARSIPTLFENPAAESKPSALVATRILPIERLLPGATPARSPNPASASAERIARDLSARTAKQRGPQTDYRVPQTKLRRYGGHVLVGLLTLIAVAVWKLPPLAAGSSVRATPLAEPAAPPASAEQPAVQPQTAAAESENANAAAGEAEVKIPEAEAQDAKTAAADSTQASTPGLSAPQDTTTTSRAARSEAAHSDAQKWDPEVQPRPSPRDRSAIRFRLMERAAVDALVAGDYANAQRLYSQLSSANPGIEAFKQASRILSTRGN